MLEEDSRQLKSIKAAIDPNKSPQHLPISDISVQTKVIKETEKGVFGEKRHTIWNAIGFC